MKKRSLAWIFLALAAFLLCGAGCGRDQVDEPVDEYDLASIRRHIENAEYPSAIRSLMAINRQEPENLEVLDLLARAHLLSGDPGLAEDTLFEALELDPGSVGIRMALASMYNQVMAAAKAREQLLILLEADLTPEERARVMEMLELANQRRAMILASWAEEHRQAGEPDRAEALAVEALELDPNNVEALIIAGEMAYRDPDRGYDDEALELLNRAVELSPRRWRALVFIGDILRDNDREREALEVYKQAFEFADDKLSLPAMARRIIRVGADEFNLESRDPEALFEYGFYLLHLPIVIEAFAAWNKALELDPGLSRIPDALKDRYLEYDDIYFQISADGAAPELERLASKLDPDWPHAWTAFMLMGETLDVDARYDESRAWYEKAFQALPTLDPDDQDADWRLLLLRGDVLWRLNRIEEAEEVYQLGRQLAPPLEGAVFLERINMLPPTPAHLPEPEPPLPDEAP